jgi:O-antigen/teichoic acid export membrane protein
MMSIKTNSFPTLSANSNKESLSERVIRGSFWVFALRFTNRGLGLVRKIVLARMLAPEDFGLLGIAFLSISTLETFSKTGFQAALVQKKADIKPYLDTAWTVSAIRGVILFGLLFFAAPFVAEFFGSPQATLIIRIIGMTVLLSGFKNIGIILFQKELEFKKQFFYHLSGTLTNFVVAIVLAFTLRNVWALVWGGLAASFVQLFMSYCVHPYNPTLRFEQAKFDHLFAYGKWVLGQSIVIFLITQGDDIFVGKVLGVTALGFYQMAYTFSNLPATEITHVISQVTFPAYSKLQDDIIRLRDAYFKILQLTAFLSVPAAGLIIIFASDFINIFLGEKWMPCVSAMKILALWGLIRSIGATTGPVFQAIGRPKTLTKIQILHFILLAVLIYPLSVYWEILGTSLSVLLATLLPVAIAFYVILKVLKCEKNKFYRSIGMPLINTIIVISLVDFIKKVWIFNPGMLNFFLLIIIYLITYFIINFFFNKFYEKEEKNVFRYIFELQTLRK